MLQMNLSIKDSHKILQSVLYKKSSANFLINNVVLSELKFELFLVFFRDIFNLTVLNFLIGLATQWEFFNEINIWPMFDIGLVGYLIFWNLIELSEELNSFSSSKSKEKNLCSIKSLQVETSLWNKQLA